MSSSRSSPGEPATGSAPDVTSPDPIERIAYLLGPSDGTGVFAPAGDRWRLPARDTPRAIVWGRSPLPSGTRRASALRAVFARERALGAARRGRGARVHRIPPQTLGGSGGRNALRSMLLGGAVVELPLAGPRPRVLDAAVHVAGVRLSEGPLHLSSSGSILARVRAGDGAAVLRVGVAGAPGDPARGAAALAHLSPHNIPVPRLLATGEAAGASWSLETALPGRRPGGGSAQVSRDAAALCAALPPGNGPPAAPRRDLEALAALLPERADALRALAHSLRGTLRALPSVLRHGDLWVGNLLVDGGRLSGVVDWDAWDPGAVPGADLLHLHATGRRIAERCELGEIWESHPWRDEAYRSLLDGASATIPGDVLAIAWWAGELRGTVSRHPSRAADERWLAINVDGVLRTLRP
ncbi:MAG: phosphotransferase [Actinomycetota bacterium]